MHPLYSSFLSSPSTLVSHQRVLFHSQEIGFRNLIPSYWNAYCSHLMSPEIHFLGQSLKNQSWIHLQSSYFCQKNTAGHRKHWPIRIDQVDYFTSQQQFASIYQSNSPSNSFDSSELFSISVFLPHDRKTQEACEQYDCNGWLGVAGVRSGSLFLCVLLPFWLWCGWVFWIDLP